MTTISISQLKTNPAKAMKMANDFPILIENRNQKAGYILSTDMYETLVDYIENHIDKKTIESTDFKKGKNFEDVAKSLGL